MKSTASSEQGSPLLKYAFSKLNPDVFSHPVWTRFGKQEVSGSQDLIGNLLSAAEEVEKNDPDQACQLLLICAACQNNAGQPHKALKTIQRTLALAERASLAREAMWALWGACAISFQQENYEQTASHLTDLQAVLLKQKEWILADFVDVVRQSLSSIGVSGTERYSGAPRDPPSGDVLALTFNWLQQWGNSALFSERDSGMRSRQPADNGTHHSFISALFSIQRWQGLWHALFPVNRNLGAQISESRSQVGSTSVLPPETESSVHDISVPLRKQISGEENDVNHIPQKVNTFIPVAVHMLGTFRLTIGDLPVKLPASRGLSVLKYLLLHHKQNVPREVLMDIFWPDAEPETARNNLNVAIHSLRTALRTVFFLPVILFEEGAYRLAPDLQVWLDVEEFERYVKSGQRLETQKQLAGAATEFESALSLYQGDFLEENPYEDWAVLDRERLRLSYLEALEHLSQLYFNQEHYAACISICQLMLSRDRCREDTHCLLMRCYSRQGQFHLALRQYQNCVDALSAELQVGPASDTTRLYERIRRRERV